ncbi:MAG: cytochrome c biogenesis protein CcsA [Planctomycetota bacterium]
MSTTDAGRYAAPATASEHSSIDISVRTLLMPLASLKLTVVLFGLSIALVFAGTMAQIDHDIWFVVHNYFRTSFAWIDFQVFLPRAWNVPGGIWFPGGWLIGAALGVNLLAAHALRFKVAARGKALGIGLAILTAGIAMTWLVIQSGLDDTVESELSPRFCNGLWHAMRFALGAGTLGMGYTLALNYRRMAQSGAHWLWWLGTISCVLLAALSIWLFANPEAQLDPSGLRIMWQLIKSTGAGVVLLVGCYWVFGRRAGIVLLHGGIALLMFSELWTGLSAKESQMRLVEGQTLSYAEDIRTVELAVVDKSDGDSDRVTVVPLPVLVDAFENDRAIDDDNLPFSIRVKRYLPNAQTRFAQPSEDNPANKGLGLLKLAKELPINTGVGADQGVDTPAAYVELLSKDNQQTLGVYLLWVAQNADTLMVDGKPFEMALRFEQIPKPYSVKLIDFSHDQYAGTTKAKNFASLVQLEEPEKNVDREFKIWMNNPLRYGGDTLYQSGFDPRNPRATTLQVMTNSGWMIPYVSCMIVLIGMLAQFGSTFWRFARRDAAPKRAVSNQSIGQLLTNWKSPSVWVPFGLLFACAGLALYSARVPKLPATEMQIHEFGALPVAYNGRVKPFDTLARNTLTVLSDKASFRVDDPQRPGKTIKQPAIFWLLEFLADTPESYQFKILRIDNLDVLQTLGLEPREGFRYSIAEVVEKKFALTLPNGAVERIPLALHQAQLASDTPENQRDLSQAKFLELGNKLNIYGRMREAFSSPRIRLDSLDNVKADMRALEVQIAKLRTGIPRPVPPLEPDQPWQTMLEAEREVFLQRLTSKEADAAAVALRSIFDAYTADKVTDFNTAVAEYRGIVEERAAGDVQYEAKLTAAGQLDGRKTAEKLRMDRIEFESFFNHFNPFVWSMALYLFAFVLAASSWLGWNVTLNRSANWILWFTFALHTYALVCRIYISGRPPVTNLYSSAVFIGWAAVAFALVFEKIYRFGVGNLLAAMIGFPTLFIAYGLAGDGDTFEVLQAVLDTQFWLATHVVCITLGYSTTLLAGFLGLVYVLMAHVGGQFNDEQRKQLIRMTYGTLCFATFFSFVGTVLGGLWADDSWGRFWGWDPKENGALMIVIWNALVLHARWGAMIRQRGLAVLAVFGNVVTAWSWFGVNQMGRGLHNYGETEGITEALLIFALSQLLIMGLGSVPEQWWRAKSTEKPLPSEA